MIDRYRKTGGFVQLVALLETCGPVKREKFLEIIRNEAPSWADELSTKTIDIDRVFSWGDDTLAEILAILQDLTLAVTIAAAPAPLKSRLNGLISQSRRRKLEELIPGKPPTGAEIASMHLKIIEAVRRMAMDGQLRFERFDAALAIEDGIESILDKRVPPPSYVIETSPFTIEYEETPTTVPEGTGTTIVLPPAASPDTNEIASVRKKLVDLTRENAVLRQEVGILRAKLDQIKKIA